MSDHEEMLKIDEETWIHDRFRLATNLRTLTTEARAATRKLERAANEAMHFDVGSIEGQLSGVDARDLQHHIAEADRALRAAERITTAHHGYVTKLTADESMWDTVTDTVTIKALTEAVQSDRPEWEVSELIEKAVRAAIALPAATQP